MSTQPAPALVPQPEPTPAPPKEIPELTDAYRKAHKSYVLASGLLAAWELIGISLKTGEKWGIELKSPTAVPLILFVLVIYSGYKMTIEWMQCNPDRQKHPAAKWDYRIAHGIAFSAIAISTVQYLLHIQLADFLGRHQRAVEIVLASTVLPSIAVFAILSRNSPDIKKIKLGGVIIGLLLSSLFVLYLSDHDYRMVKRVCGFAILFLILAILVRFMLRSQAGIQRRV